MMMSKERILKSIGAAASKIHHVKVAGDCIRAELGPEEWRQFAELTSEASRVEWMWGRRPVRDQLAACTLNLQRLCTAEMGGGDGNGIDSGGAGWKCEKDEKRALAFKAKGNSCFGNGDNEAALEMYTEALLWIPIESAEMAIIHANRSAALFHLELPSLALVDIHIALAHNYPTALVFKLQERAGRSLLKLGQRDDAKVWISKAITALQASNLPPNLRESKLGELKTLCSTICKSSGCGGAAAKVEFGPKSAAIPIVAAGPGKFFQNASKKLKMAENSNDGRYMVATCPIFPGDVLVVEKAFVSSITPEYYHRQCSQCFTQIRAPIACTACALVSYCSISCRDSAWTAHHVYECAISGLLAEAGLSITSVMALRLLTQAGPYTNVLKWMELAEYTGKAHAVSAPPSYTYPSDRIDAFLNLVAHSEERSTEDWFQRTVMALFLMSLLKLSGFCGTIGGDSGASAQDEIRLGSILVRVLQILQFNAHEVAGWDPVEPKSYFLGGAVFPTLALFNHSCNPALVRYFINDTVIVQAIRSIAPGEEVTENYGPLYTTLDRTKRRAHLKSQYWFNCKCQPCAEDWPLLADMCSESLQLRCASCHAPLNNATDNDESLAFVLNCPTCQKPANLLKTLKLIEGSEEKFNQASEFLKAKQLVQASVIFEQLIKFFDSTLVLPFKDYHLCQEGLRKCVLCLGNQTLKYW